MVRVSVTPRAAALGVDGRPRSVRFGPYVLAGELVPRVAEHVSGCAVFDQVARAASATGVEVSTLRNVV